MPAMGPELLRSRQSLLYIIAVSSCSNCRDARVSEGVEPASSADGIGVWADLGPPKRPLNSPDIGRMVEEGR